MKKKIQIMVTVLFIGLTIGMNGFTKVAGSEAKNLSEDMVIKIENESEIDFSKLCSSETKEIKYVWSFNDEITINNQDFVIIELPDGSISNTDNIFDIKNNEGIKVGEFTIKKGSEEGKITFNDYFLNNPNAKKGKLSIHVNGKKPCDDADKISKNGWPIKITDEEKDDEKVRYKHIQWQIYVNLKNETLSSRVIEDEFIGSKQELVETSFILNKKNDIDDDSSRIQIDPAEYTLVVDEQKQSFKIEFNDTISDTIEVLYNTKITDENYLKEGSKFTTTNTVKVGDDVASATVLFGGSGSGDGEGKTNIVGKKTWDDQDNQDGIRPQEIIVELYKDTKLIEETKVSEATDWTYEFKGLAKYQDGKEITYSIKEVSVPGYETVINGFNLINKHEPEIIAVTGNKYWDDQDNQDGIRPQEIIVELYKDTELIEKRKVSEATDWTYEFTGLAKYQDGKEITYSIKEVSVPGYETVINGFDLINTYIPMVSEEPKIPEKPKEPVKPLNPDKPSKPIDNQPSLPALGMDNNSLYIAIGLVVIGGIIYIISKHNKKN